MVNGCNSCIKILTFIGSNVGLTLIVSLYILAGGLIFQALESDIEKQQSELFNDVASSTDILVEEIWNMTKSNLIFNNHEYINQLKVKIFRHKANYMGALLQGYSPYDNIDDYWTLSGSILYSTTLVTTIGKNQFIQYCQV